MSSDVIIRKAGQADLEIILNLLEKQFDEHQIDLTPDALEDAIKALKQEGCLAIDLEVEADHSRAEHLYRRKGFEKLQRARWVKKL